MKKKSESLIEQAHFVFNKNRKTNSTSLIKLAFDTKSNISDYLLLNSKEVHQKSLKLNLFLDGE